MHPMTYRVAKAIPQLEFEQFRHMEDRERLNEIRALAEDQVRDDNPDALQERYWNGRNARVGSFGERWGDPNERSPWRDRTERELTLEAGLEPLLSTVITAEQRVLLRQVYDEQADQREIAKRYGVTQPAISQRLGTIHKKLREALLLAYGPKEVEDDNGSRSDGDVRPGG